ncbi:MAG: PIN domain-containing protein [Alphaproteobacteria bacterium]|nr:PIN domain-containing protein [Alphaproteobacteria bacterium]
MRIVLDTDVMVAALRSDVGASRRLLVGGLQRRWTLVLSVPLVVEYEAVLTRPEHLRTAGIGAADVAAILDGVVGAADRAEIWFQWRPMLPDPADDMVLEAAVNGGAKMLATFNRRHFAASARRFGIDVLLPAAALERLET